MAASACADSGTEAEGRIQIAADPTSQVLPTATALPTTEAVTEAAVPLPTPITLSGGQGIVLPTATPEGGAPEPEATEVPSDESYNEAGTTGLSYNEAGTTYNEAGTDLSPDPTPTPAAAATPTPAPTSGPAPTVGPTATPRPTVDDSPTEVSVTNGAEVYTLNCARCHGADGLGDLGYTGVIGAGAKYGGRQGLIGELTNGHPFTFGFGDKLSPQEISDVVNYVTSRFG